MLIDLQNGGPLSLNTDIAIIGAGAAGLTMARHFLDAGKRVVLLESGGLDWEAETADLNAGRNVGQDYYPLDHARLRFFGGTTAIWGGRCSEFDPIDFEKRDWVPHSGWPIDAATMRPHYDEARKHFGLPAARPSAERLAESGVALPKFDPSELTLPMWSFDDQFDRFSAERCFAIIDHPRCTAVVHATVREIVAAKSGRGIEKLDVRSLNGRRMTVTAQSFVLAAGGIENPRLLLASTSVMPNGLGNQHDQVGRYFMEHPHARGGRIVGKAAWDWLGVFGKHSLDGGRVAPLIAPSEQLQRREGLLNTSLTVAARRPADASQDWATALYLRTKHDAPPTKFGRSMWKTLKRATRVIQRSTDPLRPWLGHKMGMTDIALIVRAEQAPNPDSRVMLSGERDAIGQPRVALDWRTNALDVDSVAGLVAALTRESRRLGLGTVEPAEWLSDPSRAWATDPLISTHPIGGYHHIGTTRMSVDPKRGVTDAEGRVHGIDNLYVAGSSLFPTSGWANPTLTIVALALRTADAMLRRDARSNAPVALDPAA